MRPISALQGWLALLAEIFATYHAVGTAPRDDWVQPPLPIRRTVIKGGA